MTHFKKSLTVLAIATLSGCATVDVDQSIASAGNWTKPLSEAQPQLALTDSQKQQLSDKKTALLSQTLDMRSSVDLMLSSSPEFQALLAQGWANAASAGQTGRIPNPVFNFERVRAGDELELGRLFSFGLLDLISVPFRQSAAKLKIQGAELQLASDMAGQIAEVQQLWVEAVLANQKLAYAERVLETATAGATLAKRLEEAGNFTATQRIQQQLFYSDAAVSLALAKQDSLSAREKLGRKLGLSYSELKSLKLPDQLPALPESPLSPEATAKMASKRLDVEMAKLAYNSALKRTGIDTLGTFTDIEAGIRRDTVFDNDTGERANPKGYEVDIRLPLFDWGGLQRDRLDAELLVKANLMEATLLNAESTLRESYGNYRTAWDIARHFRDEVIPMQETLAEESVYKYNGMLIGTFELLSESRSRVKAVQNALEAQASFFRAQLALESTLIGKPLNAGQVKASASSAADTGGGH